MHNMEVAQESYTFERNKAEPRTVTLSGHGLTVDEVSDVSVHRARVAPTSDPAILARVDRAQQMMHDAACEGAVIYGVTTGFGGMADIIISRHDIEEMQHNMLFTHKAGLGGYLPEADVRAAMLLRANSHLRGASGIRRLLVERLILFINEGVTPCVPELGSIGASGDLVPLSYIAGALIGHDAGYLVDFRGRRMPAVEALERLELPPLRLQPKEALAMLNGTSVMTGIAVNRLQEARQLFDVALQVHALLIQGLNGTNLSFHPFIHAQKPHPGQRWVAERMSHLLHGSALVRDGKAGHNRNPKSGLIQDRYAVRCLPQYLGPVVEGFAQIRRQLEVEINSTNDNPLIDVDTAGIFYGGNFLGEYVGVGMDQLRFLVGLVAKHVDVQISMVVSPQFSNGLPPSLVGNQARRVNMGLKALQIAGNSIMPLISFLGNSLADRYPTHAEQHNQNINSQGFGSANLARQSLDLFRKHLAVGMIFGVQSVDLRAGLMTGSYDAGPSLSSASRRFYEAVREVTRRPAEAQRPWLWNDFEHNLDEQIAALETDLATPDSILMAAVQSAVPS